jgi:hypothetical protein
LAILVLLFRRLPIVLALYKFIPTIRTWREAIFTGWFGPIGVGAIFYYTVALESIPADGPNAHAREILEPVVYFMVLSSVIAHGITIPLFYISKFATRTLTRTSDAGNQVLRIPKIELSLGGKNSLPIDEADLTDIQLGTKKPAAAEVTVEDKPNQQRHTAITILTPDDVRENYRNQYNNFSSPNTPARTPSINDTSPRISSDNSDGNNHHDPARRSYIFTDDEENEDSTYYLPISRKSSFSGHTS